jgi:hypothetical protein
MPSDALKAASPFRGNSDGLDCPGLLPYGERYPAEHDEVIGLCRASFAAASSLMSRRSFLLRDAAFAVPNQTSTLATFSQADIDPGSRACAVASAIRVGAFFFASLR